MTTKTATKPKLSRVPRGHWRNHWHYPIPFTPEDIAIVTAHGAIVIDLHNAYGYGKYPSREIAEQKMLEEIAARPKAMGRWVTATFFPDA